jgi:hypothetical protein
LLAKRQSQNQTWPDISEVKLGIKYCISNSGKWEFPTCEYRRKKKKVIGEKILISISYTSL